MTLTKLTNTHYTLARNAETIDVYTDDTGRITQIIGGGHKTVHPDSFGVIQERIYDMR